MKRTGLYWTEYRIVGLIIDTFTVIEDGLKAIATIAVREAAWEFQNGERHLFDKTYTMRYTFEFATKHSRRAWRIISEDHVQQEPGNGASDHEEPAEPALQQVQGDRLLPNEEEHAQVLPGEYRP